MMFYSDDPVRDAELHDAEMCRQQEQHYYGRCDHCHGVIYDYDECYNIDGEVLVHDECMLDWMKQFKVGANDMGQIEKHEETPVVVCEKCEQGVWEGEKLYDGMCPDCFSDYIENLLTRDPDRIAEALEMQITRL